jgi:hypothetical protein
MHIDHIPQARATQKYMSQNVIVCGSCATLWDFVVVGGEQVAQRLLAIPTQIKIK